MDTVVAMSGGVDSSLSAWLLRENGTSIAGMFMKNWEEDDRFGECAAEADAADARRIAEQLDIPFYTRNLAAEYWDSVFEHFLSEYRSGRTPNPDVLCNREIKFKTFFEHALDVGATRIATGHYARVDELDGRFRLLRGVDTGKDQSYFLYTLGQTQLAVTDFPLGQWEKQHVRTLAEKARLHVHDKKDSTGICFIGERNFKAFLGEYIAPCRGSIEDADGYVIGEHDGAHFYTLGQRQGLGIGGQRDSSGEPWYVVDTCVQTNVVTVAQGGNHPLLFRDVATCIDPSWTSGEEPREAFCCSAKARYRQPDQSCTVEPQSAEGLTVSFDEPQRAMTPGQSIVFYRGDECLGGAVIDKTCAQRSR